MAARRTGKIKTVSFCEFDPYCHTILNKHWPEVPIIHDIRQLDTTRFIREHGRPWIITGGFPCQPWSVAGKREGHKDSKNRDLWPEMFRVISDLQPQYVLGENVPGFINLPMGIERTSSDLEKEYEVATFNIPACAVTLAHERKRVWIIAKRKPMGNTQHSGSFAT